MYTPTVGQIAKACGARLKTAERWRPALLAAMAKWQINTAERQAMFLAQIGHESLGLARLVESTYYTRADRLLSLFPNDFKDLEDAKQYVKKAEACANRIYANQNGNGDEASGDGWRYRARCPIGITGLDNYAKAREWTMADVVANPELLEQIPYGADAAGAYWYHADCNAWADCGNLRMCTIKINGGLIGIKDRTERFMVAKQAYGLD